MGSTPESSESRITASINDVATLLASLRSGALTGLLGASGTVADCENLCGCKTRWCDCDNKVSDREWEDLTYPEFLQMRQRRIDDLRLRLRALEEGPPSEPERPGEPR